MITPKLVPQTLSPIYNDTIFVLESDNISELKFELVVDLYIEGTFVTRLRYIPNIDGYVVVNTSNLVAPFISTKFDNQDAATFLPKLDSSKNYELRVYESYVKYYDYNTISDNGGYAQYVTTESHTYQIGDLVDIYAAGYGPAYNGVQTVTAIPTSNVMVTDRVFVGTTLGTVSEPNKIPTLQTSSLETLPVIAAFQGVETWDDIQDWDYINYTVGRVSVGEFLTVLPSETTVKMTDRLHLNYFTELDNEASWLVVNTNTGTYLIANPEWATIKEETHKINIGPEALNNSTDAITPQVGSLPIIQDTTEWYTIQMMGGIIGSQAPLQSSEVMKFNIDRRCSKFENYPLVYLDDLGSYATVNFTLGSKTNVSLKRSDYDKNIKTYNPTTNTYGYVEGDGRKTTLNVDATYKYSLTSDWLSDIESSKVQNMLKSTQVYHLDNGVLKSVNITTNSYTSKTRLTDKLFNYKVGFEYANKNTSIKG